MANGIATGLPRLGVLATRRIDAVLREITQSWLDPDHPMYPFLLGVALGKHAKWSIKTKEGDVHAVFKHDYYSGQDTYGMALELDAAIVGEVD